MNAFCATGWKAAATKCAVSEHYACPPDARFSDIGFRVAVGAL
jgi:hypothetical protein